MPRSLPDAHDQSTMPFTPVTPPTDKVGNHMTERPGNYVIAQLQERAGTGRHRPWFSVADNAVAAGAVAGTRGL